MDFIALQEVLSGIGARVSVPQSGELAEDAKASKAAGLLRQALHNASPKRPQWVQHNSVSDEPEYNDQAIHPGAMAMLEHASGWYRRTINNRNEHVSACLNAGLDPNIEQMSHSVNDGQYPGALLFRPREIGFERGEVVAFLNANGVTHALVGAPDGPLLMPLGDAAPMLVDNQFRDLTEPRAIATLAKRGVTELGGFSASHTLRGHVEWDVQRRVDEIVKAGKIKLYDSISLLPTNDISTALVERDELVRVLQAHPAPGIAQPQAKLVVAAGASDGDELWKEKAKARARQIIKDAKEKDLYPSQNILAGQIAREFRAAGCFGTDGKPLSGAYIKRHALSGINSAIGKLQSTSMRQGK